jgi:DNA mismatch repair protein MutL
VGKIQKLPETLIRLIAAGEVIERPASVAKELVENSLDAGARRISVDLWGAGRTRLRVADDGEGMTREDAEGAFGRHATSKLKSLDDLQRLETFGFRGEALPSIAAVSRLELTTRTASDREGRRLKLEGGKLLLNTAIGVPVGTTIDVQDLFFNTPARDKFLKRDGTEKSHIVKTVQEMALAHPQVAFEVTSDGKAVMALGSTPDSRSRLADLWGAAIVEGLLPLEFAQGPVRVRGFVNQIAAHHATKGFQTLYVNQRCVQQRMLTHAIYQAYHEWLPVGRHPIFCLFVDVDPALVDVNVHPTKREVRFSDERAIYEILYSRIRGLFRPAPAIAADRPVPASFESHTSPAPNRFEIQSALSLQTPVLETLVADRLPESAVVADSVGLRERFSADGLRPLGQFQKVYLIAEQGEELVLVDQHAAAERVLFERLLAQGKRQAARQRLLVPVLWEVTPAQAEILLASLPQFETLGFGLESFGPHTFALKEWPAALPESRQARRFLDEVLEALEQERPADATALRHQIAARAACRAAIMAGDAVSPPEALQLFKDLEACDRPLTCPHGRPTYIRFPKPDLDRRFRRI